MRPRRAVIFDDNEIVLGFFRDYFSFLNYEVLTFREPTACPVYAVNARSCPQHAPCADVMLTDYHMPRMNGVDLLRTQLRRGCRLAPENKALLSGHLDPDTVDAVRSLGVAYFEKPVQLVSLSAWLSECEERMDLTEPLGDRRTEQRVPVSEVEWYQHDREATALACLVLNVSSGGLCLKTPGPLPSEQMVHITSRSGEFRRAVVRWSTRSHDGSYLSGLRCW